MESNGSERRKPNNNDDDDEPEDAAAAAGAASAAPNGSSRQKACQTNQIPNSWRLIKPQAQATAATQVGIPLTATAASKSLSSQVMEYYQKYSQNSNLNQYFSLPASSSNTADGAKYYYSIYELTSKYVPGRQGCIGQDYGIKSYIPKERRRWVRPPLIGQSSSTEGSSSYMKQSMQESQSSPSDVTQEQDQSVEQADPLAQSQSQQSTISTEALIITEEKTSEPQELSGCERKTSTSPTSSVASHKPLEWDSGADVGYLYAATSASGGALSAQRLQQLSTLERMALARGCSAALRLDPEGTSGQQQSSGASVSTTGSAVRTTVTATVLSLTTTQRRTSQPGRPHASSTPVFDAAETHSGSESEVEITPIVKNHLSGIVAGDDVDSFQPPTSNKCRRELIKDTKEIGETPKSTGAFKLPQPLKYASESDKSRSKPTTTVPGSSSSCSSEGARRRASRSAAGSDQIATSTEAQQQPLKKSSSMNLLASPTGKQPLKRSQSELNLLGIGTGEKAAPKLIFNSTSSIATVVNNHNKPATCDKLIQTSMRPCEHESVGVQVSVLKEEEEKPPLPKRATSLAPRLLNSILKSSKSTYKVMNPKNCGARSKSKDDEDIEKDDESSLESSRNASLTPQADDTENVTGRANGFEYFPGHIYENVPNGSSSHVSSVDTGRSNSTMPNTSSSIDEKLWGDSDSLVRDLERSVSILKSLVDANKLDKQVKRRLIHHVVKRLCNAKYTDDDKIEHNLEENVPWNPDDARNKVYRTEIIQALAKNTTDSSDDWKPTAQKKKSPKKPAPTNESRGIKEIIDMPAEIESSNSDKFDRNTDRTVMDGRKARMGLRTDDCNRRSSSNTPTNKSESSECFLPQRGYNKNDKIKDMFITSTSNSSPQDQNRVLLDVVVNGRRSPMDSSNEAGNSGADWRLPATASERRFEMRRNCSVSDSADSKLVTYAEMEKRNQLIWITSEISHLSNLKKLLEQQPKSKPERTVKTSPRKNKPICAKPQKTSPPSRQPRLQNGDDSQLSRQWSSHCNLASCAPAINTSPVRRLKKRNSCTQTASGNLSAYSRTGSEIVSASIQSSNTKLANVCVQTPRPESPLNPPVSQANAGCPVHQSLQNHTCTCTERVCNEYLCCKSKSTFPNHLHVDRDRGSSQSEAIFICNDSEDAKETKNQMNAKKLKCTCEADVKTNDKPKFENAKKLTAASQTCNRHYCEDSGCSCSRCRPSESSTTTTTSQSQKDCECEAGKLTRNFEVMQISKTPRKKLFERVVGVTDRACQCKKSDEAQTSERSECSYHSGKKNQPYFLAGSNREPNSRDCYCGNKMKDRDKSTSSLKPSSSANSLTDRNCCRVCGTVYQNKRNCRCVSKSYPKPVAYELKFVGDEDRSDCHADVEINSIEQGFEPRERTRRRDCECGISQPTIRPTDCDCRKVNSRRIGSKKKCSLQEYLVTNNPGFADNVEIRRQYVSEIQRLRQLRKDRRVQLLAMASTTNVFTSPRPPKVTKFVQKKITDEEMRARLKKRYFQLTEVRAKQRQQQLQEETRCNKLMAKIFCKKLQQKVLKGQVDLSQSVSVISNL